MRIENAEQGSGDFRKLILDFQMNPGGKKRETLQEPLDVRIFTTIGFQREARGDFRIFFRKLRSHLPQER